MFCKIIDNEELDPSGKLRILVINPGSTSTKIGVFVEEESIYEKSLSHSAKKQASSGRWLTSSCLDWR
jgi:hypothetical protein